MSVSDYDDGIDAADQELVATSEPDRRNWVGIIVALAVIFFIFGLVALATYLVTKKHNELDLGDPITFMDSLTWSRYLYTVKYQWSQHSNADVFYFLNQSTGDIMTINLSSDNSTLIPKTFLSKNSLSEGSISSFSVSADNSLVLIPFNRASVFRHSSTAHYKIVSFSKDNASDVFQTVLKPKDLSHGLLQLVGWGPTSQFIVFVCNNNLYYSEDPLSMDPVRITDNSGNINISYGIANWLYEEEVLYSSKAFWISSDNKRIAYLEFNDTLVREYYMEWFGSPKDIYVNYRRLHYPKAGDTDSPHPNPIVRIAIYDVKKKESVFLPRPSVVPVDHYVTLVRWFNETHVLVGWLDREQIAGTVALCSSSSPKAECFVIYHESVTEGWMELTKQEHSEPIIDSAGQRLFTILHNNNFRRIVEMKVTGMNQLRWITPALYDVSDILHLDKAGQIFFLSCRTSDDICDSTALHIHRIGTLQESHSAFCLTCSRIAKNGHLCEYSKASFGPSGDYFFHECLGPDPYVFYLRKTSYPDFPIVNTVEDNYYFRSMFIGRHNPMVTFKTLRLSGHSESPETVQAKIFMPRQLNESHISQYPLILKVYGGPNKQVATKRYEFGWHTYLASNLFFIVAAVDGRGTPNRGSKFLFSIKNNLANYEVDDQLDALKTLRSLPFVNKTSVAVFGWSYGGFLAIHMLGNSRNVNNSFLSCGVAVAPVTDFSYYDTAYTERYLGRKREKTVSNYDRTNVNRLASNFWNKDFLLIHGTADDNVHYQNSAHFVKALVQENVDFDFMTYPDDHHGLTNSRPHVFQKITSFLVNSFNRTSEKYKFLNENSHMICSDSSGRRSVC